ncbi:MAG: hypothetical protein ACSHX9_17500 [Luteolibacter sp.]
MLLGITESDGLALAMMGVMGTAFAVIAMILICVIRNASKQDTEVDRLLDEVKQEEKKQQVKPIGAQKKKDDWEKDGDWWKGD